MRLRLLVTIAAIVLLTVACGASLAPQTQLVPESPAPTVGVSALAWRQLPGLAPVITGRVITVDSLAPLAGAVARLLDIAGTLVLSTAVDADDQIEMAVPQPGRYVLAIGRIGYAWARAEVEVPLDGGVVFVAVMAPQTVYVESEHEA